jgi:hypothetical protein
MNAVFPIQFSVSIDGTSQGTTDFQVFHEAGWTTSRHDTEDSSEKQSDETDSDSKSDLLGQ